MKKQPRLISVIQRSLLSRKVLIFSFCLFASALFWLVNALNNSNSRATFHVPVTFTNLPKDKVLMGELPKELTLEVKATGLKLFFLSLRGNMDELTVDFSLLKKLKENVYAFSPSNNYYLGKMITSNLEVVRVKPDSLYFTFNNSYFKTVPVKPDVMVDFEQMFNLSGKIKSNPPTIDLSGDSNIIKKIDTIYTEKIILSSLGKSVKQKARLIFPDDYGKNLFSSATEVQLEINVDKFTDSEVEVPLEILNQPAGMKVRTFPEKVTVKFQVGMNNFEKVYPYMFRAVVDFKNRVPEKNYMKISLVASPDFVSNVKLFPETAQFLLK
jgi:YbbR domain-containing protein